MVKKLNLRPTKQNLKNVTFILRRGTCPPVSLNNLEVPQSDYVRYLGLYLDSSTVGVLRNKQTTKSQLSHVKQQILFIQTHTMKELNILEQLDQCFDVG